MDLAHLVSRRGGAVALPESSPPHHAHPRRGPEPRLLLLCLVPRVPGGRLLTGVAMLSGSLILFWLCGALAPGNTWPGALFFCVILAYITPVFHYITELTEHACVQLCDNADISADDAARALHGIAHKSWRWLAGDLTLSLSLWLSQSYLLAGDWQRMAATIAQAPLGTAMVIGALFVWVFTTCTIHSLLDNARLFRRIGPRVRADLLDPDRLMPVGRMAVGSTLLVIGAQASFPIMWAGGSADPWTTIPGLAATGLPLAYLILAPIVPVHLVLRAAKRAELARINGQITALRAGRQPDTAQLIALQPLLTYRREVASAPEWPLDVSSVARFALYLVIVPITWVGAALIEYVVDRFIGG